MCIQKRGAPLDFKSQLQDSLQDFAKFFEFLWVLQNLLSNSINSSRFEPKFKDSWRPRLKIQSSSRWHLWSKIMHSSS